MFPYQFTNYFFNTKSTRAVGRSTQGVKLLDLEDQDKVPAAVVIPPDI